MSSRSIDQRDSPSPPSVPPKPEPAAPKPAEWKGTTPTLPGLTDLSPIYRVFPADIVKPLYLPDPTAFPNEINRKIWDFCQGQLGLKRCGKAKHGWQIFSAHPVTALLPAARRDQAIVS